MLKNKLEALWDDSLEDKNFRFELMAQEVAVKLANAAAASGMSQQELADKLGWKKSRISKVLHGASNLTLKTLFEISEALDIEFDIHFGGVHHLNQQVEIIQHTQRQAEAILEDAKRLNKLGWQKSTYRPLTTVNYVTDSMLEKSEI